MPSFALRFSTDGGATFSPAVQDNAAADVNPAAGIIQVNIGAVTLVGSVSGGTSPPVSLLNLQIQGQAAAGAYDLVVQSSLDGLQTAPPPQTLTNTLGDASLPVGGVSSTRCWIDDNNGLFATTGGGIVLDTSNLTSQATTNFTFSATTPYSITAQIRSVFTSVTGNETTLSVLSNNRILPSQGAPDLLLTKTADSTSVPAGQTIGFTVMITNTGTADAHGVQLNDPLPAGSATDLNWTIDTTTGNPSYFQITGAQGSQVLSLNPSTGITLAAGASLKVHITSPTSAGDAGAGNSSNNSFDTSGTPAAGVITLGAAKDFTVLGLNLGAGELTINAATILGNVGIGPNETAKALQKATVQGNVVVDPTATIEFHDKDFIVSGTFPLIQNLSGAQNAALAAYTTATGLPTDTGFSLGNLTGSTTITATPASRADGVTAISLTSLNFNNKTLTLSGNATDVFVINVTGDFLFAQSKIVLSGGLTPNHVLFNLVGPNAGGHDVTIYKSTSVFNGTMLAPYRNVLYRDPGSWAGEIIGGQTLKVYSGATFSGVLVNTATVTGTDVQLDDGDTATATITITAAHQDFAGAAVVGSAATPLAVEQVPPLVAQAIALWEATGIPAKKGVDLSNTVVAVTDLPVGVLALTYGNTVLIDRTAAGHGWFIDPTPDDDREFVNGVAVDPAAVGKVDLLTVVTHELGHLVGYGSDAASTTDVMGQYLGTGARRLSMADEIALDGGTTRQVTPGVASQQTGADLGRITVRSADTAFDVDRDLALDLGPFPAAAGVGIAPGTAGRGWAGDDGPRAVWIGPTADFSADLAVALQLFDPTTRNGEIRASGRRLGVATFTDDELALGWWEHSDALA